MLLIICEHHKWILSCPLYWGGNRARSHQQTEHVVWYLRLLPGWNPLVTERCVSSLCRCCNWYVLVEALIKLQTFSHPGGSVAINSGSFNNTWFYLLNCAAPFSIYHPSTPSSLWTSFIFIIPYNNTLSPAEGYLGNCGLETVDFLTTSRSVLVCGSVFITAFALWNYSQQYPSSHLSWSHMLISEEEKCRQR